MATAVHPLLWVIFVLTTSTLTSGQAPIRIPVGALLSSSDSHNSAEKALIEAFGAAAIDGLQFEIFIEKVDSRDAYLVSQAVDQLVEKHSIWALVVPSLTPSIAWSVKHHNLPLISLKSSSLPARSPEVTVEVSPDPLLALIDVMRFYKWSSLHYFYQNDDGLQRLQTLQQTGSGALNLSSWYLHRVEDSHTARSLLRQMDISQASSRAYVVMDMEPDLSAEVLLDVSKATYLEKKNFQFLLAQPVDDDMWQQPFFKELSVSGFQLYDPQSLPQGQTIDKRGNTYGATTQWLLARDAAMLIVQAYGRLFQNDPSAFHDNLQDNSTLGSPSDVEKLTKYIRETHLADGSTPGPLQFGDKGHRRGFTLDILESTEAGPVKAFTWSDATGLNILSPSYVQRVQLFTKTLIVTSVLNSPYLMIKENSEGLQGNDRYQGYVKDLLDLLANYLSFEYQLNLVKDNKYGSKNASFQWNGMIGEVIRREADMAVADLTITSQRLEVVDFSSPYMNLGISLMVKKPSLSGSSAMVPGSAYFFLSPFAAEVWGCLLVALAVVGLAHFAIGRLLSKAGPSRSSEDEPSASASFLDSLWFAFGSLFLRQTGIMPKCFSTRVLSGVWWVFAFFILAMYLTSLCSLLVTNELGVNGRSRENALLRKSAISILEESLDTGYPEIGIIAGGSTHNFFRTSRIPIYARYYELLTNRPELLSKSNQEGVARVREGNGKYAFFMESTSNEYHSMKDCFSIMIPQLLDSKGFGLATAKGSQLGTILNHGILRMKENGDLQKLYNHWWTVSSPCEKDNVRQKMKDLYHSSFTMSDVGGVFYLLVAGVLLTILVVLVEVLHRRMSHKGLQRVSTGWRS